LDEQDDAHWSEQLKWRAPSLLVYQFGANESADGFVYPMADYNRTMKDVIRQGQQALPQSSCLVIGAMDRAVKKGDELISLRVLPVLIEEQHKVAADMGCAFFDTYAAMGGKGSMARWVRRGLGQADLTHPTAIGSEIVGNWLYRALVQGYRRHVGAGQVP
jgi:lysophospholipase L1-like esterase